MAHPRSVASNASLAPIVCYYVSLVAVAAVQIWRFRQLPPRRVHLEASAERMQRAERLPGL